MYIHTIQTKPSSYQKENLTCGVFRRFNFAVGMLQTAESCIELLYFEMEGNSFFSYQAVCILHFQKEAHTHFPISKCFLPRDLVDGCLR